MPDYKDLTIKEKEEVIKQLETLRTDTIDLYVEN